MTSTYLQTTLFFMNRPEPIRQTSLLMLLAAGIGNSAAMIDGLRTLANSSKSPWSDRIHSLRALLEQGLPLSAALAGNPDMLPEQTVQAIRVGEMTGTLRDVLTEEAGRLSKSGDEHSSIGFDFIGTMLYVNAVAVVLIVILSFITINQVPKLKKIFEDFDTELPGTTQSLIFATDFAVDYALLVFPPILAIMAGLTLFALWATYQKVSAGRVVFSEHWGRFWIPDVLRLLSISVATGYPLSETLHIVQRDMRPGLAARSYSALRSAVEGGTDCVSAMLQCGLLKSREANFLHASQRNGHLDWGLSHLARHIERRRLVWFQHFSAVLQPAMILLMGFIVLYVVTGLFLPMIKLQAGLLSGP